MKKSTQQIPIKKVGKFHFNMNPYSYGYNSKILLAKTEESSSNFPYIAKCISIPEMKKMGNLISYEIANKELYWNTECITRYQGAERTENNIYLVYDFFDSYTLSQLISNPPPDFKTYTDKLNLASNISKTIKRLHDAKLIHRNLNPSHILVSKDLKKILFCGVKSIHNLAALGYPSLKIGSEPYIAPEIRLTGIMKEHYDEKVDIYSFGIILFQLFSGIPKLIELPQDLNKFYDGMSKGIKQLIQGCLKSDPENRIKSEELIMDKWYIFEEVIPVIIDIPFPDPIPNLEKFNLGPKERKSLYTKTGKYFGKGSYGKVFEVLNIESQIKYAMKQIPMNILKTPHEADLIIGEINLLYTLRNLSFVITLIDAFICENYINIILEICNGGNLDKEVEKLYKFKALLNMEDVKLIAWNLAEGLYQMHKWGIVHRDLKPANVLLVTDSNNRIIEAKICDLGLGRKVRENNPEFNTILGTKEYWAPEILQKKMGANVKLTPKVDVFAYGLVLYYMIYGIDAVKVAIDVEKTPQNFVKGIINLPIKSDRHSPDIIELMKKCLDPNPETRIPFEQIIKHPFFSKLEIPMLPNTFNFDENESIYKGTSNLGFIDSSGKYWVKLYKEMVQENKDYLKYIEREISFLKISKAVPHIVQIVDYGKYINQTAIIFKYCNGDNLITFFNKKRFISNVDRSKVFEVNEIKLVAKSLIQFIEGMQRKNYVHRAINPTHILVETDASQKIIDVKICGFRSSKSENQSAEVTFVADANYKYFDPTAIVEGYSEESDLWSIGLVIYFMSTGEEEAMNDLEKLRKMRGDGKINVPPYVDPQIKKFIEFCIRPRKRGSMSNISILEAMAKDGILI